MIFLQKQPEIFRLFFIYRSEGPAVFARPLCCKRKDTIMFFCECAHCYRAQNVALHAESVDRKTQFGIVWPVAYRRSPCGERG